MVENEVPPEFKKHLLDLTVPVGTPAKLIVQIKSSPQLTVKWYHEDVELGNSSDSGSRIRSDLIKLEEENNGIFSVQINQVASEHTGKWICRAENNFGKTSCFSILNIQIPDKYRAPVFVKNIGGCLWDNGTLSLDCEVMGVPTPILRWFKDGKELLPGASLKIKANSKESKSYLGTFACEAENCMGSKAAFSKVYARHFGKFLKQFGNLNAASGGGRRPQEHATPTTTATATCSSTETTKICSTTTDKNLHTNNTTRTTKADSGVVSTEYNTTNKNTSDDYNYAQS